MMARSPRFAAHSLGSWSFPWCRSCCSPAAAVAAAKTTVAAAVAAVVAAVAVEERHQAILWLERIGPLPQLSIPRPPRLQLAAIRPR